MASSQASVASNMPIVREHVRADVAALLFSPDDPEDAARSAEKGSESSREVPDLRFSIHLFHGGNESHAERCDEIGNAQTDQHWKRSKSVRKDSTQ